MSTFGKNLTEGGNYTANVDLSGSQFRAVKQTSTARQLGLASTGGEAITGILQNNPKAGEAVEVTFAGLTKAQAGTGGFAAGQQLQTEASTGKLIVQTSTNKVVAVAVESANANEIALVRVVDTAG